MALLIATKAEGVMVLELNAPQANTYSYEMMRELDDQVLDARMDESIHVLMLTGAGSQGGLAADDDCLMHCVTDPQRQGSRWFDEVASRSYLLSHARRRVEGPEEQIERVRPAGSVRRDGPGHGS
jgi:enoyl-CoA hydratase/carnithine racemase